YFSNVWGGINVDRNGRSVEMRSHPWTYNIVGFFNDFYNGEFGFKVPVERQLPTDPIGDAITGLRWGDTVRRVNYTINYLYTWTAPSSPACSTGTISSSMWARIAMGAARSPASTRTSASRAAVWGCATPTRV